MEEETKKNISIMNDIKTVLNNEEEQRVQEQIKKDMSIMDDIEDVLNRKEGTADAPGLVDVFLSKMTSRKLIVFIVATICFFIGKLDAEHWMYVSICYIGAQTLADMIYTMKGNNTNGSA